MQRPSAQGIASLFRGNPAPLQQRIQMEQQGKPGLPPDLQKLLALNIVTNEKDAVAKQQAMDQLNQMQGQQGKPPTVMQTVQEQARQKMQAQQVQAQQQQQAMQAMMQQAVPGPVPPGTPQPQSQPQGIDELPVEFSMAGGGIISFEEGGKGDKYETRIDKLYRENREEAERPERKRDEEGILKALAYLAAPLAAAGDVVAAPIRGLYGLTQHGKTSMTPLMDARARFLASSENAPAAEAFVAEVEPQAATRAAPAAAPAPKPIADLKSLAEKERRQQAPRPAPTAPVAPVAETPAAPQFQDSITMQGVLNQADAARLRGQSEYEEKIGRPSSAALDKLMAEYESQKAAAQGPQEGFGRLMEYLGQIAATPRGMSSFEAGAAGARGVQSLEKERAAQRAGLTEKQIGLEQKRMDMDRQYAKDLLGVGNAEYDRALKANLSLFEEEGKSKRQAMSDASAMTRDQFKAQADKDLAAIRFNYERQVRAMPTSEERFRKEAITAYKKAHPGADDFTVLQAIGAFGSKTGGYESAATALRAATSTLEDPESTNEEKVMARQARNSILQGMKPSASPTGGAFTVSAGGKTYTFPTQEAANKFRAEAGVK